ncbi:ABC transporter ATP-binding protein [Aureibacillus halotolerans]|uniref:ABC-2 type transport system ATP-binding protein n=1 Tax=Aureibacillus halotolerans TaxID=1508390 RepID=A0A4V3D660_9BACI|nr:ABC transporter ATP-binding protein [Aureibacillus halotolerans]TDQ42767.1 ABC-2 type transport system ATP-binding protein [Aureibacillus halotolerans]
MKALHVEQLMKNYGNRPVLNGLNLTINEGELFGFVGRNGAGKSTFIHIITGLIKKSSGQFGAFGQTEASMNEIKKIIGVMPDASTMYSHLRAADFLKYMAQLKNASSDSTKIQSLLESVGLKDEGRKKIASFSFGMKKKLSLAQALLGDPKLLFLDEPTSGLDPESAKEIQALIKGLNEEGKTILLTSHNLNEIEKLCHRMAILHQGRVERVGSLEELQKEANRRVTLNVSYVSAEPITENWLHEVIPELTIQQLTEKEMLLETDTIERVPHLTSSLVKFGASVYGVTPKTLTLEDIFFQESDDKDTGTEQKDTRL